VSEFVDKILIRRADSRNCDARRQNRAPENFYRRFGKNARGI
jgi:hypothetical protein